MPRTKFPPTPAASTEPIARDKSADMEGGFTLPPAAMNRSPPTSPVIQRKRTLSGSTKTKEDLPPPPSRARKIIQMKPKEESQSPNTSASSKSTSPKRKQPSATSAAGRKIARKTAHSIIERRRRSKMNEEFGVLKDMIPACNGVEMHKLAILQAGIEYVKYLQGCVEKLQDDRYSSRRRKGTEIEIEVDEDDEEMDDTTTSRQIPSVSPQPRSWEHRRDSAATASTATTSAHPSPALRPNVSSSSLASQRHLPPLPSSNNKNYSTSPPPLLAQTPSATGVSPAFNAIHFSPDLSRTYSHQQQNYHTQSPNILPLPKAAMPMHLPPTVAATSEAHHHGEYAEATATAALMMLTNDRRPNGGSGNKTAAITDRQRGGGMSVRDLLSH